MRTIGLTQLERLPDRQLLQQLYHEQRLSTRQIAGMFDTNHRQVLQRMRQLGIARRPRRGALLNLDLKTLHHMYVTCGLSEKEIGLWFEVEGYVVKRELGRLEMPRRPTTYPTGAKVHTWKGNDCGYVAFHIRVSKKRGKPAECEYCGVAEAGGTYDWANLSGNYADITDYMRLCRGCHKKHHAGHISLQALLGKRAGRQAQGQLRYPRRN